MSFLLIEQTNNKQGASIKIPNVYLKARRKTKRTFQSNTGGQLFGNRGFCCFQLQVTQRVWEPRQYKFNEVSEALWPAFMLARLFER